jgi:hypothetical protein
VDYERFDAHDGLLGAASQLRPMPSLVLGDDGLLWMATANRINWIDPRRSCATRCRRRCWCRACHRRAALQRPARAQAAGIDHQPAYRLHGPEPERAGAVRFRYRLDGVDRDWQDPTRRQAFYTNLSPGDYRFRVMAANEDGVWNPQEAELAFSIPPTFMEPRGSRCCARWRLACCCGSPTACGSSM